MHVAIEFRVGFRTAFVDHRHWIPRLPSGKCVALPAVVVVEDNNFSADKIAVVYLHTICEFSRGVMTTYIRYVNCECARQLRMCTCVI